MRHFVHFLDKTQYTFRSDKAKCDTWTPEWTKNVVDQMSQPMSTGVD